MKNQNSSPASSWSLGAGLLIVGFFFLFFSFQIKVPPLIARGDPGPRALPQLLALVMLLGGAIELVRHAYRFPMRKRQPRPSSGGFWPDHGRVLTFTIILFAYVLTAPWAFYTSTFVFSAFTIWYLGAPWWTAAAIAAVIGMVVWGLFVRLFLIPLPTILDWLPIFPLGH